MKTGDSVNKILKDPKDVKQAVFPGMSFETDNRNMEETPEIIQPIVAPAAEPPKPKNELDAVEGSEIHIAQLILGDLHKQHNHATAEKESAENLAKFWTERIERLKAAIQDKTKEVNERMKAHAIPDGSALVRRPDGTYVFQAPRARR